MGTEQRKLLPVREDLLMAPLVGLAPAVFGATSAATATGVAAGSVAGLSAATATSAGLLSPLMAALPSLSTMTTIAGLGAAGLSTAAQLQAGKAAEVTGEINANLATQEARQRIEAGKEETFKLSKQANKTMGEQTLAFGASGFSFEGSPLEAMAETAREYERDVLMTGYGAMVGAEQKMNEANIYRWQGEQQKKAATWSAGTTLLRGFGKYGLSRTGQGRI